VKNGLAARFGKGLRPRREKRTEIGPDGASERSEERGLQEREVIEEIAAEFTTEELQEFLEADQYPIQADPVFKEQLREKLWRLLQRNAQRSFDDA
jgi:hypothetical protein